MKHKSPKNKQKGTKMQTPQAVVEPVTEGSDWTRERSTDELRAFINRRSVELGDELDEIDFELAGI